VKGVLYSEWTKFTSLRSTAYTLAATALIGVGVTGLVAAGQARQYALADAADRADFDPSTIMRSFLLTQLTIGVLGVLVVTSEWATGMMRTSLTVVPGRGRLFAAKALVFTSVALVAGQAVGFSAFLLGQRLLASGDAPHLALGDPGVLRSVIGYGLYLALTGLLGVALGTLLRSTAGSLAALVAATLLVPAFMPALPRSWAEFMHKWWPPTAGTRVMALAPEAHSFGPWAGLTVLAGAVAAVTAVAVVVFRRRDV
jgi:ABC-type transport system involved in multi-copper enzyme maturation permease subunit